MSAGAPCACDLPDDFAIERADHLERVVVDGQAYRVLVSLTSDERHLVREDAAIYEGGRDHPAVSGLVAFIGLALALVGPLVAGYLAATGVGMSGPPTALGGYIIGVGAGMGGLWLSNRLLWQSWLGAHLARFNQWVAHRAVIEARDTGGATA